jgi:hypothetical protein
MTDSVELEVPSRGVEEVGTVEVDGDTATGVVIGGPVTVPGVGDVKREDAAGRVRVSGIVGGGGQNVQYEVGRLPLPVSPGDPRLDHDTVEWPASPWSSPRTPKNRAPAAERPANQHTTPNGSNLTKGMIHCRVC